MTLHACPACSGFIPPSARICPNCGVQVLIDFTIHSVATANAEACADLGIPIVIGTTGMSDDEWWYTIEPFLSTMDFSSYPVASRVGAVVGELYGLGNPDLAFDFGLERILDGLERLIAGKVSSAPLPGDCR